MKAYGSQLLVLLFGMCGVQHASGQWAVRVNAGGGSSRIHTDLRVVTSRGEFQVVDRRFSWYAGATASRAITKHLGFSTGLAWSAFAGRDEYWIRGNLAQDAKRQVHYLYMPLLVEFTWHRIRVAGGYQLGTPVVASGSFNEYYEWYGTGTSDQHYATRDLGLKRTDIGVVAEAGYNVLDRINMGVRYYRGLQDIKDHSDGFLTPLSMEQFVVTVGYRVIPRKKKGSKADDELVLPDAPQE